MEEKYDPTLTLDELKVQIRKSNKNPNIGNTTQVVLKDGPRSYKIATLFEILDPNKGDIHHYSLKIETYKKTKKYWYFQKIKFKRFLKFNLF